MHRTKRTMKAFEPSEAHKLDPICCTSKTITVTVSALNLMQRLISSPTHTSTLFRDVSHYKDTYECFCPIETNAAATDASVNPLT